MSCRRPCEEATAGFKSLKMIEKRGERLAVVKDQWAEGTPLRLYRSRIRPAEGRLPLKKKGEGGRGG